MSWSRSFGERSLSQKNEMTKTTRAAQTGDDELALPVGLAEVIQRVHRHQRGDEAAGHRADGPEPHGGGTPELGAEVTDERRRGHEDGALDDPEQADDHEIRPLAAGQRNADGGDEPDESSP